MPCAIFLTLSLSSSVFSPSLQLSAHISLSQKETALEAIAGDPLLLGAYYHPKSVTF